MKLIINDRNSYQPSGPTDKAINDKNRTNQLFLLIFKYQCIYLTTIINDLIM